MPAALAALALLWLTAGPARAADPCPPVEEQPVKIEVWMSKKRAAEFRQVRLNYARMGHTSVSIFGYPGPNPSRVAAIGRCVPAYIARHALQQTLDYFGEIRSLVHPGFVGPHWIGLATSLFAENSQRPVTPQQLERLLDPALTTREFHALYRKYTEQPETVRAFGQILPNPKRMTGFSTPAR